MGSGAVVPREANLRPPVPPAGVILRGELVDTLREHGAVPVVVLTAPPGYGKTTVLVQWAEEDERPFSWYTADRTANDPVVLVTYLMLALQRIGDVEPEALAALGEHDAVAEVLLPRLGALVADQAEPFVLVVDDAGALTSRSAVDVLMTVASHLPPGCQLVVCGRTVPHLPFGRMTAERRLLSVGPDSLRFSPAEVRAVLRSAGTDSRPEQVSDLLAQTEGWPAAVHLTALALGRAAQRRDETVRFSARDEVVGSYLRETVLAPLPVDEQEFLTRTSVLARLSGPLCDAVLGTTGSAERLRELARRNVFVLPLDSHDHWYRYHGMFQDALRQVLAREDPRQVALLHSRASHWLEAAGELDEAIEHAQAAHETARAARLVWSQAAPLLASGRSETLRRWLAGFTNEQVVGHAPLALTAAWCALDAGRASQHFVEAAERAVFDATRPGEQEAVEAAITLLHAQAGRHGVGAVRRDALRAAELQAADDLWRPFAQYLAAVATLMAGDTEAARAQLTGAERLAAALDLPSHRALCLAQLAAVSVEEGDWDAAAALADSATATVEERHVEDSPLISEVHCVAAVVLAKRGQTAETKRLVRRCMRMVAVMNHCPPWLAVQTRYLLARAHLLLGDTPAARVLLSEAQAQLSATADAGWLRTHLDEAWKHVEQFPLATGVGPSSLTSAELRVLQLLPTHLSFEQIARRLLISRNTVKTQAIATYRKLGVSSRAEAVERARSLGMIQA